MQQSLTRIEMSFTASCFAALGVLLVWISWSSLFSRPAATGTLRIIPCDVFGLKPLRFFTNRAQFIAETKQQVRSVHFGFSIGSKFVVVVGGQDGLEFVLNTKGLDLAQGSVVSVYASSVFVD